nr:MAG TPA: hypothetical protein [Caudoviricetes sp.]
MKNKDKYDLNTLKIEWSPHEEQIKVVETVKGLIEQAFMERRNKL